jgi:hypothetical protein
MPPLDQFANSFAGNRTNPTLPPGLTSPNQFSGSPTPNGAPPRQLLPDPAIAIDRWIESSLSVSRDYSVESTVLSLRVESTVYSRPASQTPHNMLSASFVKYFARLASGLAYMFDTDLFQF